MLWLWELGLSLQTGHLVYVVLTVGVIEVVEVIVQLQVGLAHEVVLLLTRVRAVEGSALGQQLLQPAGVHSEPRGVVASAHVSLEDWFLRTDLHGEPSESVGACRGSRALLLPLDQAGRGADDEEGGHQGDADDQDQQGEVQRSASSSSGVGFCKERRFIKNCPESVESSGLL